MAAPVLIELTWRDVHICGGVAISRTVNALSRGRRDRYGMSHDGNLGCDIEWMGCIGEMAAAKYCNRFWSAGLEINRVDASDLEIRTVGEDRRRLILHRSDRDDLPFVSVLVTRAALPTVTLRGFIFGRDGKRAEYWQDPGTGRPAFFVPNDQLLPMTEWQHATARAG